MAFVIPGAVYAFMAAMIFLPFPYNVLMGSIVVFGLVIGLIMLRVDTIVDARSSAFAVAKKQGLSDEEAREQAKAVKVKFGVEP